jgi:ribosomal protein S14
VYLSNDTKGNTHVLPSSRLTSDPSWGCKVVGWPNPDGTTTRLEVQLIYCASCGAEYGYAPACMTFDCYLCRQCFEEYGNIAGTYAQPDEDFHQVVRAEILARFGRDLTAEELAAIKEQGGLGPALEALERDSPYRKVMPS